MTWIHCTICGEPVMHLHDSYIKDEEERKEYFRVMEELKQGAICQECRAKKQEADKIP